jgi:squalene-associated FAD-dependent desaturase
LGLLARLGSLSEVRLAERLHVPVLAPGGRRAVITRNRLPVPLHLAGSLARYRHLAPVDRARLGRAVVGLRRLDLDDPALDEVTFGTWLRSRGQSQAAIDALWNLIALPTLNLAADEASLALAAMVFRTGFFDRPDAGDIGWSRVPLGRLHGERAERALAEAGVDIELGAPVDALEVDGPGTRAVVVGGRRIEADVLVVATAVEAAAGLLGESVLGPVSRLSTSPIVNVHLVFDRPVTDLAMFAGVSTPVQFVFDRTETAHVDGGGQADEQCLSISLSGADCEVGRRPEDLIASYREALAELLPEARRAQLVDAVVSRERAATFRAIPGTAGLRPGPGTALDRVLVAGAWCATGWPATMEGAVRSGAAAAHLALRRLAAEGAKELEAVRS